MLGEEGYVYICKNKSWPFHQTVVYIKKNLESALKFTELDTYSYFIQQIVTESLL